MKRIWLASIWTVRIWSGQTSMTSIYAIPTFLMPISNLQACWVPITELLRLQHVDARTMGNTVRVTLPKGQRQHVIGRLVNWLFPSRPLHITISFHPDHFIRNVHLEYDALKMPLDCPCFDQIGHAMRERGWASEMKTRHEHEPVLTQIAV